MILVDAGNTRAKFGIAGEHGVEHVAAFAYADDTFDDGVAAWLQDVDSDHAMVACVARDDVYARIVRAMQARNVRSERIVTSRESLGLVCGYDDPSRWGVDRFLNALAAWRDGFAPFVLASAGTAIAIDVVDARGKHRGGLIAPSPRAMREAVLGTTAQVKLAREGQRARFGTNTEDGLESGTWLAAAALIDRAHAEASHLDLDDAGAEPPQLCLTGGDALALSSLLRVPHDVLPDAALRGLWHLAGTRERRG